MSDVPTVYVDEAFAWELIARIYETEGLAAACKFVEESAEGTDPVVPSLMIAALQRRGVKLRDEDI